MCGLFSDAKKHVVENSWNYDNHWFLSSPYSKYFMVFFTWEEYFIPSHLGSVRVITEPFYVGLAIIVFDLSAFVLGLLSAKNTFRHGKFTIASLGASFLLIAGLLFFSNLVLNAVPHIESPSIMGLWSFLQPFFGIPIIAIASISLGFLVSIRKEFDSKEINNSSVILHFILVLTSIVSALSAVFSIVPYEGAAQSAAGSYPLATMIVGTCTFALTLTGVLLVRKKHFYPTIALTVFSLLSALSIPFIFMSIYPWIGEFYKGLVTESPVIILSAASLVLALFRQRNAAKQPNTTV